MVREAGRAAAVLGAVLAVALSGCGGLPTDGDVHAAGPMQAERQADPRLRLLPPRPARGESPLAILAGFLQAQGNPEDGHAGARRYLTPDAAAHWDDEAGVVVYVPATLAVPPPTPEQRVTTTATRAALIGRDGGYQLSGGQVEDRYAFAQVGGEWRLSEVPPGLRLTETDVSRSYRRVEIQFLAPGLTTLVPDPVFLPVPRASLPTALVRALLAGPSAWLAPAVRTAVPVGTKLLGSAVLDGGIVEINLSGQVQQATPEDRARLSAQLIWTLRQLPEMTGIRLLVEGKPFSVDGSSRPQPRDKWSTYAPDVLPSDAPAYLLTADGLETLTGIAGSRVSGQGQPHLRNAAVSPKGDLVAGLLRRADGRSELWAGPLRGTVTPRVEGDVLSPPSWGSADGGVWVVRGERDVLLVPPAGEPIPVATPDLGQRGPIDMLRVSRDGTRVAVVEGRGAARQLLVGRVTVRDGATVIDGVRPVAPTVHDVSDVAWLSADSLAVLAHSSDGRVPVWLIAVDGSTTPQSLTTVELPAPPTALAAAPPRRLLVESDGQVWAETGGSWARVAAGVDPIFPG